MPRDLMGDRGDLLEEGDHQVVAEDEFGFREMVEGMDPNAQLEDDDPNDDDEEDEDREEDEEEDEEEEEDEPSPESDEELRVELPGIGQVGSKEILAAFQAQAAAKDLDTKSAQVKQQEQAIQQTLGQLQDAQQLQRILEYPAMRQLVVAAVTEGMKNPQNLSQKDGRSGEFTALFKDPRVDQLTQTLEQMKPMMEDLETRQGLEEVRGVHDAMRAKFGKAYDRETEQAVNEEAFRRYKDRADNLDKDIFEMIAHTVAVNRGLAPQKPGAPRAKSDAGKVRIVKGRSNRQAARAPSKDPTKMSESEYRDELRKGIFGD